MLGVFRSARAQAGADWCAYIKNLKGQFVLEIQGYQGEPPGLPEEQPAEEALLSMLLSWAPECIEIQLGENRQESCMRS